MREPKSGLWSWLLQRVTAVLLAVGLLVHFIATHFAVERPVTFAKVHGRLLSPAWVWFDLALLGLAVYHGLNGLHGVLLDYGMRRSTSRPVGWALAGLGLATFLAGAWILRPFAAVS